MVPPFRAIVVFHYVARLNSIAQAAAELNVTPSAVSQQIKALEEQIGAALITRKGRSISLTETGERYFELISDKVDGVIRATDMMRGKQHHTTLVIRATPTVSSKWLLPRLGRFMERVPDAKLRIDGSNEPVDFTRDNVDLEIRHGLGGWPGLYTEPLTPERFVPVCAPMVAAAGSLSPQQVLELPRIRSAKAQIQWSSRIEAQGLDPTPDARLSFDRSHMAIDAAVLGYGVALESELMIEAELRSGRLVVPVGRTPLLQVATQWLVCPRSNLRRQRLMRLIEWLREEAQSWAAESPINSIDFLN
ncbi:LysR substrate-binding domain-containing protein [Paracoccus sp. YLB-12]|uniref:LysR substrate-binding domain-containing protein n=1 Tax=Paracoccus maritimus TaxID=2933292 RepID=A0ABT2K9I4_9RHOB|nr:LysR substrate-binding domain-containing protein [Paracoccus sp. YLB-12]MCT4333188.1 LysR substrate-binding domain-containing protein [Paracoccus sp. YLB-12]